jgi:hypothetical protein
MSNGKHNRIKQLRLKDDQFDSINRLVEISGLSESDVIRQALRYGLPLLESGKANLFGDPGAIVAEESAKYKKSSTPPKQKE